VRGEGGQRRPDSNRLIGGDPPDKVVFGAKSVDVLDGDPRLPHTAEPVQDVRHHNGNVASQRFAQSVQNVRATGEVLVPLGILPQTCGRPPGPVEVTDYLPIGHDRLSSLVRA